ncbi:MAG: SCO family protein [Pseudomonadota bacterium]
MRYVFAGFFAAIAVILLVVALGLRSDQGANTQNAAFQPYGVPFELIDHHGEPITEAAFRGQPTAVFFGFTHCPEVCPTTVYEMNGWFAQLGEEADNIDAYFVTVDPERDTAEMLEIYLESQGDRVTGITGDPEKVWEMVRGFNVYFKKFDEDEGGYNIDHTASIFLLDSNGAFRKTISYGENPETALQKLRDLAET